MQTINFNSANYKKFYEGKGSTIRLGRRLYQCGITRLACRDLNETRQAIISDVSICTISELSPADLVDDGFGSVEELCLELGRCYEKLIDGDTTITYVKFKNISPSHTVRI